MATFNRKGTKMPEPMSVYRERAHLVAFLTTLYPSTGCYNDPEAPLWLVVYVESPVGQMSWHISPEDVDLFDGLNIVESHVWDGHTTMEKYQKLHNFIRIRRTPSAQISRMFFGNGKSRLDNMLVTYESRYLLEAMKI